jgi:hypothetical protein
LVPVAKALIARINGDELKAGVGRAKQSLSDMQSGAIADIAGKWPTVKLTQAENMAGVNLASGCWYCWRTS